MSLKSGFVATTPESVQRKGFFDFIHIPQATLAVPYVFGSSSSAGSEMDVDMEQDDIPLASPFNENILQHAW